MEAKVGIIDFPAFDGAPEYEDLMSELGLPVDQNVSISLIIKDFLKPDPDMIVRAGNQAFPIRFEEGEFPEKLSLGMVVAFETQDIKGRTFATYVRPVHTRYTRKKIRRIKAALLMAERESSKLASIFA